LNVPKPVRVTASPFFKEEETALINDSRAAAASFFVRPVDAAIAATKPALFIFIHLLHLNLLPPKVETVQYSAI
jgi:hypothetical protein